MLYNTIIIVLLCLENVSDESRSILYNKYMYNTHKKKCRNSRIIRNNMSLDGMEASDEGSHLQEKTSKQENKEIATLNAKCSVIFNY